MSKKRGRILNFTVALFIMLSSLLSCVQDGVLNGFAKEGISIEDNAVDDTNSDELSDNLGGGEPLEIINLTKEFDSAIVILEMSDGQQFEIEGFNGNDNPAHILAKINNGTLSNMPENLKNYLNGRQIRSLQLKEMYSGRLHGIYPERHFNYSVPDGSYVPQNGNLFKFEKKYKFIYKAFFDTDDLVKIQLYADFTKFQTFQGRVPDPVVLYVKKGTTFEDIYNSLNLTCGRLDENEKSFKDKNTGNDVNIYSQVNEDRDLVYKKIRRKNRPDMGDSGGGTTQPSQPTPQGPKKYRISFYLQNDEFSFKDPNFQGYIEVNEGEPVRERLPEVVVKDLNRDNNYYLDGNSPYDYWTSNEQGFENVLKGIIGIRKDYYFTLKTLNYLNQTFQADNNILSYSTKAKRNEQFNDFINRDTGIKDKTSNQSYNARELTTSYIDWEPELYDKFHWEKLNSNPNDKYFYCDSTGTINDENEYVATVNVYFRLNTFHSQEWYFQGPSHFLHKHVRVGNSLRDVIENEPELAPFTDGEWYVIKEKGDSYLNRKSQMGEWDKITEDIVLGYMKDYSGMLSTIPNRFYSGKEGRLLFESNVNSGNSTFQRDVLVKDTSKYTSLETESSAKQLGKILTNEPKLYKGYHWKLRNNAHKEYAYCDTDFNITQSMDYDATVNVYFTKSVKNNADRKYYRKQIICENSFSDIIKDFKKDTNAPFTANEPEGKWYIVKTASKNYTTESTPTEVSGKLKEDIILEYRLNSAEVTKEEPPVTPPYIPPVVPDTPDSPKEPEKSEEPKTPDTPKEPEKPEEPKTPDTPKEPEKPEEEIPDVPAPATLNNIPETELPVYSVDEFPNPNNPDSPEEFIAVDDDGNPLGKYVRKTRPDGEKEYVLEEDLTPKGKSKLPATGGSFGIIYIVIGILISAFGIIKLRKN